MENSFASRLRFLRGKESREKFAKKLGLSPRALVNYENGTRVPKSNLVSQICAHLGININWLLAGEGSMRQFDGQEEFNKNRRHVGGFGASSIMQPIESINMRKNETADMSAESCLGMPEIEKGGPCLQSVGAPEVIGLQQELSVALRKGIELQERLLALTEQNAELRIRFERLQIDIDRRDQRIRELEKENAQLRESRKGVSPVFRAATGEAN